MTIEGKLVFSVPFPLSVLVIIRFFVVVVFFTLLFLSRLLQKLSDNFNRFLKVLCVIFLVDLNGKVGMLQVP